MKPSSASTDSPEVQRLVESGFPVVERIAKRLHAELDYRFRLEDLMAGGHRALVEAALRFDPARGVPFLGYAHLRIRGGIIQEIRATSGMRPKEYERSKVIRAATVGKVHELSEAGLEILELEGVDQSPQASADALDDLLESYVAAAALGVAGEASESDAPEQPSAEEEYELREMLAVVQESLAEDLTEQEALVIQAMYFEHKTVDEVAPELGCSRSWVSRLHRRGLGRLRRRLLRSELPP